MTFFYSIFCRNYNFYILLTCILILADEYSDDFEEDTADDEPISARSEGKNAQRQRISLSLTQIKV